MKNSPKWNGQEIWAQNNNSKSQNMTKETTDHVSVTNKKQSQTCKKPTSQLMGK